MRKRHFIIAAIIAATMALPLAAIAADNTSLYMLINFTNTKRNPVANELPLVNAGQRGPVIDLTNKTVRTSRGSFQMSGISGFTFQMQEASGVSEIADDKKLNSQAVYTIDGRRVGDNAAKLPKGIYIVNGKKVIVR